MWQFIQGWAGLTVLISLAVSIVGIVMAVLMVLWMSDDHFVRPKQVCRSPLSPGRIAWLCFKNLLGLTLLLLGVAMMITPGPGLLSILLGLSLMDLPGKHQLLHQGLRLKSVRGSMNWIRRTCGRTPLKFPRRSSRKKNSCIVNVKNSGEA